MGDENEIISTDEIAEAEWDGEEPGECEDIVATKEPENVGMEFHVSMRNYTLREMDNLIVEAAARQIVGAHNDRQLAKMIEERCIALITEKADKTLASVTAEIIDQPVTPKFGDKGPVTMREFIGLVGREYLEAKVGYDGKPSSDSYYNRQSRMQFLVGQYMANHFKTEIEKATNAAIVEIRHAIKARHTELLEAEKARVRKAIESATD